MNPSPDSLPGRTPRPASTPPIPRRSFLRRGALAGALGTLAPLVVARHVLGGDATPSPSNTLRIAAVDIGGMGQHYLEGCHGESIVALCDLDHTLDGAQRGVQIAAAMAVPIS
jgi:hypothetical protein